MISIITPVFNAAKYIESCLQSVADQYFTGLEHLVIDGGSTDGTQELIQNFAKNHCEPISATLANYTEHNYWFRPWPG